jgi:hypothetical protein
MQYKLIGLILLGVLGASCAYASANLTVSDLAVNKIGETLSTSCVNSKGYYFEIGKPKGDMHLSVYGFGGKMPLKAIVNDILFQGWHAVFGREVNTQQKIDWAGHRSWTDWLKRLSFEKNLAVILNWPTKTVYINKL